MANSVSTCSPGTGQNALPSQRLVAEAPAVCVLHALQGTFLLAQVVLEVNDVCGWFLAFADEDEVELDGSRPIKGVVVTC